MSMQTPVTDLAPTDALAGLMQLGQINDFQPLWFSVKEMGFACDVEQTQTMSGHILAIRKTRRHSEIDPATGMRVPECMLVRLDPDFGMVQATGELRSCSTCPFNKWGSAVDDKGNQSRGKDCRGRSV